MPTFCITTLYFGIVLEALGYWWQWERRAATWNSSQQCKVGPCHQLRGGLSLSTRNLFSHAEQWPNKGQTGAPHRFQMQERAQHGYTWKLHDDTIFAVFTQYITVGVGNIFFCSLASHLAWPVIHAGSQSAQQISSEPCHCRLTSSGQIGEAVGFLHRKPRNCIRVYRLYSVPSHLSLWCHSFQISVWLSKHSCSFPEKSISGFSARKNWSRTMRSAGLNWLENGWNSYELFAF